MKKKKIIFFLGNGFSQGFGFPNMNELWDICLKPNHQYYEDSLKEAKNRYPLAYLITRDVCDIELLLTTWKSYYESYENYIPSSNANKSGRGYFYDYVENMNGWLHLYTLRSTKLPLFNEFKGWLKETLSKFEITFITTNYDLLLEKILLDNTFKYHYIESKEIGSIPIRKVHGSISWFSSAQPILREYESFPLNSFFKSKEKKSYVYDLSSNCLSFPTLAKIHMQFGSQLRSDNVVPISTIIPPVIGKDYNELFNSIILSTIQDFENFAYFVIIGYSFPEADPVVKDIFVEFYNKYKTQDSKVININKSVNACEKINHIFKGNIEVIKEKWNVGHLKSLFI